MSRRPVPRHDIDAAAEAALAEPAPVRKTTRQAKPAQRAERGVKRKPLLPISISITALAVIFVIGLGATAGVVVLRLGYLNVKHVEFVGGEHLDINQVHRDLALEGQGMWSIDVPQIVAAVAADPRVKDVSVEKDWPNGLTVTITERQAWGSWKANGRTFVVDSDGVVLDRLPAPEGSPEIQATDARRDLQPGDRVDASALRAVEALGASHLRRAEMTPVAYEWSPKLGLVVVTKTGARAVLGDAQQIDQKLATWAALLDQAGPTGIDMSNIDLRFGASPAIRRS